MAYRLHCPCGETVYGRDEDGMVAAAQTHLESAHEGRDYTHDEIMFMAIKISDKLLPDDLA